MKFFFTLIFFIVTYSFNANSNSNLVFLDMQKILTTSKPGSSLIKKIDQLNKNNIKNFKLSENNLKKKEEEILLKKNVLSKSDFEKEVIELRTAVKNYNKQKTSTIENFNKIKIEKTKKFFQLLTPILSEYADKKSIDLIFQKKNLVIGKLELDITEDIIKIVNNQIKELNLNEK
tara:strand:- start:471 stop:995 length:525 start_codon:yes stop_codon:yes gene_type:complete